MKRGSVNSRQCHGSMENSKLTPKHKLLLEDYFELQKENVSKKRKLREIKQKREILSEEVRFLRQRCKYLTKLKSSEVEAELGPHQNVDIHEVPIKMERNCIANETDTEQGGNEREELVLKTQSTEKPENSINSAKKSGKKKVSWHDKVTVIMV